MSPIITAEGLVKRYGANTVLDGITVAVQPGVTGLLGSNGAGKTTLLGLILGLHQPDAGALHVLGYDPNKAGPAVRELVGYAPEHHNLPEDLAAYDLVRHLAEIHGLPPKEAINRASDVLWQVGLGEERLRPIGTMSTGQRQRVKLAAAIAHDPALVLLDEPTDGLDPAQRDAMLQLIRRVGTEFGIHILLSSHLLDEVERTCDRVVILAGGKVAAEGNIDDLRGRSHGLVVDVDDGASQVAAQLQSAGYDVAWPNGARPSGGAELEITHPSRPDAEIARAIRDAIADTNASLRRLEPRRTSLADVFLHAGASA